MNSNNSSKATWSMVCGILGLLIGLFGAVPAVILGHLAIGDTKRLGYTGGGKAIAGLIMGYIQIGFFLAVICYGVV